jgi:hypothetical protein
MKARMIAASVIAFTLLSASSARAELRHVELKTLGMD